MRHFSYGVVALFFLVTNACVPAERVGPGSGSSLLASTDGFAKEDLAALKPEHVTLICNESSGSTIEVRPTRLDQTTMEFPGDLLKDGMECHLAVRGEIDPQMDYTWLGRDEKGEPVTGLFYMSENAKITAGKLRLPIVKLYSVKPSDHFTASLLAQFLGSEALSDSNNSEQYAIKLSAELSCLFGSEKLTYRSLPATQVEGKDRLRQFEFQDLSVSKLKGATCSRVSIYEGNTELVYLADRISPPLLFTQASVGATVNVSVSVRKYDAPTPFERLDTQPVECVSQDPNKQCLKYKFTRTGSPWVAEAVLENTNDNTQSLVYVTASDDSLADISTLNLQMVTGGPLKIYDLSAKELLLSREFDRVSTADLQLHEKSFLFGHEFKFFRTIYVHGMHRVDSESQALTTGAESRERWLALVDIKAGDSTAAQVIVAGPERYFGSSRLASGKLFNWPDVVSAISQNSLEYEIFTYADALRGDFGLSCGTSLRSFIEMSGDVPPAEMNYERTELEYCKVRDFPPTYFEGHTAEAKLYLYGWQGY